MAATGPRRDGELQVKERPKVVPPKRFHVILLNDDYTSMEFVVLLLEQVFRHDPETAWRIMMNVHCEGRGVAGTDPRAIAETKVLAVHERARSAGYPLRCGLEEA